MQVIKLSKRGLAASNQPFSNLTFFKQAIQRFIDQNVESFEAISRMSTPFGGSIIQK